MKKDEKDAVHERSFRKLLYNHYFYQLPEVKGNKETSVLAGNDFKGTLELIIGTPCDLTNT